jgi:phosphatidylserine/phosphatidylglycerophosphate/cardiolipin synthase-like enzyme
MRQDVLAALAWLAQAGAVAWAPATAPPSARQYHPEPALAEVLRHANLVAGVLPILQEYFLREDPTTLVVSWPQSLGPLRHPRCRNSRLALLDLIDSAQSTLTLLFPFIDHAGAADVAPALQRALQRGVGVVLITRHLTDPGSGNAQLAAQLRAMASSSDQFIALQLSSSHADEAGRELLHAKVLVADGGSRGYVGSANLTGTGLGESVEIGVVLGGTAASSLAALVDEIAKLGQYV